MPDRQSTLIAPAVAYLDETFTEPDASCEGLAALCGISYSYLHRIFVKKYHVSPHQYLIKRRIGYSCELLRSGRFSIGEIAERCGYVNQTFFSRQFKKYMGVSPRDF